MTEDDAKLWLAKRSAPTAVRQLETFVELLRTEADRQSLIARSTYDVIWCRHIVDSAQLVELANGSGLWLDIGSGGGLPGVVIAILRPDQPLLLVEPRKGRAAFLRDVIKQLDLDNAEVRCSKVQQVTASADTISARAVSSIGEILGWTESNVSRETQILLPRGRNVALEVDIAKRSWLGMFHVEQSITEPNSGVVVITDARRR